MWFLFPCHPVCYFPLIPPPVTYSFPLLTSLIIPFYSYWGTHLGSEYQIIISSICHTTKAGGVPTFSGQYCGTKGVMCFAVFCFFSSSLFVIIPFALPTLPSHFFFVHLNSIGKSVSNLISQPIQGLQN